MMTTLRIAAAMSLLAAGRADATNPASPNKAIPKPECDVKITVSIRYSSASPGLYLESARRNTRGGCITLQAVWEELGSGAPLYAVDSRTGDVSSTATGTWLLTESMYVEDGITLQVTQNRMCIYSFFRDPRLVPCKHVYFHDGPGRALDRTILVKPSLRTVDSTS